MSKKRRATRKQIVRERQEIRRELRVLSLGDGLGGPAKPDKMLMEEASLVMCPECGRAGERHGVWCSRGS